MDNEIYVYKSVASDLKKKIAAGFFQEDKIPSERSMADLYGINRITLRKALKELEKDDLICRYGHKGTFLRKTKTTGVNKNLLLGYVLVNRNNMDSYHSAQITAFENEAAKQGSKIVFIKIDSITDVNKLAKKGLGNELDGIFITGLLTPQIAKAIRNLNIPSVLLGKLMYPDSAENCFDRIGPDNRSYGFAATKYLIEAGHTNIALINGPSYQWFLDLLQGYMDAMESSGLQYSEKMVSKCDADNSIEGYEKTLSILNNNRITAAFAAGSRIAVGANQALIKTADTRKIDLITVGSKIDDDDFCMEKARLLIDVNDIAENGIKILFNRILSPECADYKIIKTKFKIYEFPQACQISNFPNKGRNNGGKNVQEVL